MTTSNGSAENTSTAQSAGEQVTSIPKKWMILQAVYMGVLLAYAIWCVYDGAVLLPNRGKADAEYKERQYLEAAKTASSLSEASVKTPVEEYEQLNEQVAEMRGLANSTTATGKINALRVARYEWLKALRLVGQLSPEKTTIADPERRLKELDEKWKSLVPPKPLAGYDIPLQWWQLPVVLGVFLAVAVVTVRTKLTVYRYDPASKTLTLPGGEKVSYMDLKEVDKRQWHKVRCTLVLNDGRQLPMDLLRYVPLEEWILEMEKARFPETVASEVDAAKIVG